MIIYCQEERKHIEGGSMIEENRMNRYYYACSDETHSALMKISRGDSFIGNVLWASVYAIVNSVC